MNKQSAMNEESLKKHILSQLKKVEAQAQKWNLEFLCHYLTLAEQVMQEELTLQQHLSIK